VRGQGAQGGAVAQRGEQRGALGEQALAVGVGAEAFPGDLEGVAREGADDLEDAIGALGIGDQVLEGAPRVRPVARMRGGAIGFRQAASVLRGC